MKENLTQISIPNILSLQHQSAFPLYFLSYTSIALTTMFWRCTCPSLQFIVLMGLWRLCIHSNIYGASIMLQALNQTQRWQIYGPYSPRIWEYWSTIWKHRNFFIIIASHPQRMLWNMLLIISSQRAICILLLIYLFQNLLALRFFLKVPNVVQKSLMRPKILPRPIWSISNANEIRTV